MRAPLCNACPESVCSGQWGQELAFGREAGRLLRGLAEKPSHLCDGVFTFKAFVWAFLPTAGDKLTQFLIRDRLG